MSDTDTTPAAPDTLTEHAAGSLCVVPRRVMIPFPEGPASREEEVNTDV